MKMEEVYPIAIKILMVIIYFELIKKKFFSLLVAKPGEVVNWAN